MNVLVTGGASGIGAAITKRLAADASNVVHFTYCSSASAADELSRELPNVRAIHCDFRESSSVAVLVAKIPDLELTGLVNNALTGIRRAHFHKTPLEDFETGFRENVLPVIAIAQAAIARFRKARHGRIVTVLTSATQNAPPLGLAEYVAAKAYVASLAKSWAVENAQFDIASNCVSPSFVDTALMRSLDADVEEQAARNPLRRLLTDAEVADAVAFLLRASPHVNGINLVMDAGAS